MGVWLGLMSFMLNSSMNLAIVCMVKSNSDVILLEDTIITSNTTSSFKRNPNETTEKILQKHNISAKYQVIENNLTLTLESAGSCDKISKSSSLYQEQAEFTWSKKTQSLVLSSFYYGYLLIQIPAGWLVSRFGGKHVVCITMILSSAITLVMPTFARTSVYLVVAARAVLGLCLNLGAIIGYSTSGLLCVYGFDNGWASIFYIQGAVTLVFVCCWWYVIYNTPKEHPRISAEERNLILKHISQDQNTVNRKNKIKVPWKNICSYLPVHIVFLCHLCDTWTFYLLVTCLPLFLKEVLKFDIESNGLFSCLPYLSYMIGIAVAGVGADLARSWKNTSITTIRKVFQITSYMGIAVFIFIPGYLTCEYRYVAITCICLCTFFEAIGISGGHLPNIIDIAPRYSSLIFSVSNTIATIPGIIAPIAVGEITKSGSSEEWRIVFYIASGVAVFAAIMYGIFGNSELAPWARGAEVDFQIEVELSKEALTNGLDVTKIG
ncbi:vesicular glutamate transporter 2-like isoform X2 [Ruditapes philippinarum]|uniref:vesicular glutamate transporter 2-like isoform X2 n=1 Tax=Ruditapes philippinarum TaxID=129788 RepID=UPI00295BE0DF|nr:vesicular glutamate transporter 2-like isoform X2 [Ruditapes philippinarum]